MKKEEIELGAEYRDKITMFVGVATGFVKYITGCNQVLLAPKCKLGGDPVDSKWFDEQRLERTGAMVVEIANGSSRGSDAPAPVR